VYEPLPTVVNVIMVFAPLVVTVALANTPEYLAVGTEKITIPAPPAPPVA
jgi:hypothetical protein